MLPFGGKNRRTRAEVREKQGWSGKSVCVCVCVCVCARARAPHGHEPPGSSVHGILQARILECVAILFSRGSSQPRDGTQVSSTAGGFFTLWATGTLQEREEGVNEKKRLGICFKVPQSSIPCSRHIFSTLTSFYSHQNHSYSPLSDPFPLPVLVHNGLHNPQCPALPFCCCSCFQGPWTPGFPKSF